MYCEQACGKMLRKLPKECSQQTNEKIARPAHSRVGRFVVNYQ